MRLLVRPTSRITQRLSRRDASQTTKAPRAMPPRVLRMAKAAVLLIPPIGIR
ncbi:hypothetical protein [Synechococcus sp. CBW1006]|uniref:hypothetical protein n=1 Tax=Synechococcus sp. CBW1006 TaxID=1353138 RepID=UPI001E65D71E|nr:hypothetical protein [Synechococcus sp. CBW1006]